MREIKFRAWHETDKCWYNPRFIEMNLLGQAMLRGAVGLFEIIPASAIEQYTGLKDKNGKEIYEGDILGGIFEGCYIGWCDITKSFELFNCYEHYCMACDGDILWYELSDSDIDLEVIGNVHENPELLRGEE